MKYIAYIILIFSIAGCGGVNPSGPKAIQAHYAQGNNGLNQVVESAGIRYSIMYIPDFVRALQENAFVISDTTAFLESMAAAAGHHYLHMRIAPIDEYQSLARAVTDCGGDWVTVKSAMEYDMKSKIILSDTNGSELCKLYQSFTGLKPDKEQEFIFVFEHGDSWNGSDDIRIDLESILCQKSTLEFNYKKADLAEIPRLAL